MRKPRFPDVVQLKVAMTGRGWEVGEDEVVVPAGEVGTIVEEFDKPDEAYLIEVSNDDGETTAMVTARPVQFEVVHPLGRRVPERVGA